MATLTASPREVRDTYRDLANGNDQAVKELESSIKEIRRDREPVQKLYATMMERFADSLVNPSLDEDALAKAAGTMKGVDFNAQYKKQMADSREAEIRLNGLIVAHGEKAALETRMRALQADVNNADEKAAGIGRDVSMRAEVLNPVVRFNAEAKEGAPKLEEGAISYFSSKKGFAHMWSWLFNSHYRHGRAIMKEAEKNGVSIPEQQKQLAKQRDSLAAAQEATLAVVAKKLEVEKPFREMEKAEALMLTEAQITDGIKAQLLKQLENRETFNATVKALGEKFPAHAVELRAKMEGFDKLEAGANKTIGELKDTARKLRQPLDNLDRAVSRGVNKQIKADLPTTRSKVKAQQTLAKHKAAELKKASDSIGKYEGPSSAPSTVYLGPDPLDIYMGFMIADMLSHHHHDHSVVTEAAGHAATEVPAAAAAADVLSDTPAVDPAVVNDTLGIPDDVATDVGIDTDSLAPALSGDEISGLGDSFNDASLDLGNLDVDVDVPDIDVPDIDVDVGGFDFPDIDIGGFDFVHKKSSPFAGEGMKMKL